MLKRLNQIVKHGVVNSYRNRSLFLNGELSSLFVRDEVHNYLVLMILFNASLHNDQRSMISKI